MNTKTKTLAAFAALAALSASATTADAQLGGMLKNKIPGMGQAASGAAVDPDSFLADTLETTKFMMIAAAVLADAASQAPNQADLVSRVAAIKGKTDIKELGAMKASFQADIDVISTNKDAASSIEAQYQKGSAEQRKRIATAAFNFALGAYRNVKLSQEAPQLLQNMASNPRLLMKAGHLKLAAELVAMEAKGTVSMAGSLKQIMTASKVEIPTQAETTKAREVEFS